MCHCSEVSLGEEMEKNYCCVAFRLQCSLQKVKIHWSNTMPVTMCPTHSYESNGRFFRFKFKITSQEELIICDVHKVSRHETLRMQTCQLTPFFRSIIHQKF